MTPSCSSAWTLTSRGWPSESGLAWGHKWVKRVFTPLRQTQSFHVKARRERASQRAGRPYGLHNPAHSFWAPLLTFFTFRLWKSHKLQRQGFIWRLLTVPAQRAAPAGPSLTATLKFNFSPQDTEPSPVNNILLPGLCGCDTSVHVSQKQIKEAQNETFNIYLVSLLVAVTWSKCVVVCDGNDHKGSWQ